MPQAPSPFDDARNSFRSCASIRSHVMRIVQNLLQLSLFGVAGVVMVYAFLAIR
jgi:hypothetical protein